MQGRATLRPVRPLLAAVLLLLVACATPPPPRPAESLQQSVERAVSAVLQRHGVAPDAVSVTLVDLSDPATERHASVRGDAPTYPASVVKLVYLWAAHRELEAGRLAPTPELERALRDMVVDSSNDATSYVVDVLTGTTSGPELAAPEMAAWAERRNAVNRALAQDAVLGATAAQVNACQKPWGDGPYGRERAFLGERYTNRNRMTTDATARLLVELVRGRLVSPARSAQMLALLRRDLAAPPPAADPDSESHGFTAAGLPPGARLWSKAGWTSTARHAATSVELPDGRRLVLVLFTTGSAERRSLLPDLTREVLHATAGTR